MTTVFNYKGFKNYFYSFRKIIFNEEVLLIDISALGESEASRALTDTSL